MKLNDKSDVKAKIRVEVKNGGKQMIVTIDQDDPITVEDVVYGLFWATHNVVLEQDEYLGPAILQ